MDIFLLYGYMIYGAIGYELYGVMAHGLMRLRGYGFKVLSFWFKNLRF
jgi:hypothetical protein